jgi:plasmid stability protein
VKTTLEIPDDLYRLAKVRAAHEHREITDLVSDGLRLVLGGDERAASSERALAALESVRRHPPYPAGRVQAMIDEATWLRKESWE